MITAVDRYLKSLLTFVPRNAANRFTRDYLALIHVPAHGPEKVYSLVFDAPKPILTVASYQSAVWEVIESVQEQTPELDALRVELEADHPALDYLKPRSLSQCHNYSDGRAGLDYYLLLWQRDGEAGVVECYEPYSRDDYSWATVIGALQVLASQFEYALR